MIAAPVNPLVEGQPEDVIRSACYVLSFLADAVNRQSSTEYESGPSEEALFGHYFVLNMVIDALEHVGKLKS